METHEIESIKAFIQERDSLISLFNMEILDFSAGSASVRMTVRKEHTNAASVCHGGALFSLADVAFALASNSHGTLALALDVSISFLRAVPVGETITARCTERYRGRSTGTYIIEVEDSSGKLVALLKATAFRTQNPLITSETQDTPKQRADGS
ncbi:MAG: PaaI family thioesterase [Spirochaetota bacterium]